MGHVNKWADDEECTIKMKVVFPPPVYGRFLSPPPARPDSDPLLFDGLVCGAWVIWFACVCPGAVAWLMVFKHWRDIGSEGGQVGCEKLNKQKRQRYREQCISYPYVQMCPAVFCMTACAVYKGKGSKCHLYVMSYRL